MLNNIKNVIFNIMAWTVCAVPVAAAMYAFIMPDPMSIERGEQLREEMLQQLTNEEIECESQMLHNIRLRRAPTQDDVEAVHATCDRTSAWR